MKKLSFIVFLLSVLQLCAVDLLNDNILQQAVIISYGSYANGMYGRYTYELENLESRPLDEQSLGENGILCIKWRDRVYAFTGINLAWIRDQEVRLGIKMPIRVKIGFPAECESTAQLVYLAWFDENNTLSLNCPDPSLGNKCVFDDVISVKTGIIKKH